MDINLRKNDHLGLAVLVALALVSAISPAMAKSKAKPKAKADKAATAEPKAGPVLVGTFSDWRAFTALKGPSRTCYALSQPQKRVPEALHRDPAYVFVSDRPAKNVKNEISVIMGFPMKDGTEASAKADNHKFDMIGTGTTLWLKNPAQDAAFLATLRKSSKLIVAAASIKGHVTTDSYSLHGLAQALDKAAAECK
ncbi:MAG: hypothetical protein KGQ46_01130 [Hyphomicrobiales bacterium]|nr:hypothetical protein [Hyphomicrobiales bacterium]MDE2114099.1 hypothetical protein [Hyphomicrobiales bacterium]